MKMLLLLLGLFLQAAVRPDKIASDFKVVKKQADITLYERWIEKSDRQSVRQLKVEFVVKAEIETILRLLKNQEAGPKWNHHAAAYKIVPDNNPEKWIAYTRYSMPAMLSDQDCCLLFLSIHHPDGEFVINFSSTTSGLFPVKSGVTRITGVAGKWVLKPTDPGCYQVTYLITSDRNTSVPRFISDPIIRNNLFRNMMNFRQLAEQ